MHSSAADVHSQVSETNTAAIDAASTKRALGSPVASPFIFSKLRLVRFKV